ncbi:MAG TPA: cob(I)yrinic acid a,c-diamide adenosyltransferase [Candidatus Omnitrophica bacterium]|nr:cob(I)yrinic acid a,c-diamide adenosyltransferase [Candidatus Omnitrophota bacterium]
MIHIYTGNGKGKTTSAFGLAMRACGQGLKVCVFQFLKPGSFLCGEQIVFKRIKNANLIVFRQSHPMFREIPLPALKKRIKKDFDKARRAVMSKKYGMVVLDEIINAVDQGFISRGIFLGLLRSVPEKVELVLTGRGDISLIEQYADYVTLMIDKKHPFRKGAIARRGIEY